MRFEHTRFASVSESKRENIDIILPHYNPKTMHRTATEMVSLSLTNTCAPSFSYNGPYPRVQNELDLMPKIQTAATSHEIRSLSAGV